MAKLLFRNAWVFDGVSAERADGEAVLVESGEIREVSDRQTAALDARALDAGGRALMPGFTHRVAMAVVVAGLVCSGGAARAQVADPLASAVRVATDYRIRPNIVYLTANNWEAKLDVYQPTRTEPNSTLVYIHGGGWIGGAKETAVLRLQPYLEMGWTVVNVEYRVARVSLAPAAVEDCRCALRWVLANAKTYNFDPARIVVSGDSAGGHLALTTGMLPASAGFDRQCYGEEDLKVAAIVNWYGITDVVDLLDGPNVKTYAVRWFAGLSEREQLAKRVSPLTYVRPGLPPVLTIHGDADPTVPYSHAVRLQQALTKAGVPNELLTVPGGKHGGFTREETLRAFAAIREFLGKHTLTPKPVGE